ncbi:MAG: transcription-repair coupling factor [Deltaproteobacteria bacterium]|nr:transcription-repair coupling factor [Deltaproteobacteria bacterium]
MMMNTAPAFDALFDRIGRGEKKFQFSGLQGSAKALLVSILFRRIQKTLIVVSPTEKEGGDIFRDISFFLDGDRDHVFLYPAWDVLSTDIFAFQREVELSRIEILYHLLAKKKSIIILPLRAMMQKVMPRPVFTDYVETISIGDSIERDHLTAKLIAGGYTRVTLVEEKGEFSLRGHVIDVYPPAAARPFRMEFIGDELESIREFDTASQRSTGELAEFILLPTREVILSEERKQQAASNIRHRANELELPRMVKTRLVEMMENNVMSSVNPLFIPMFYESLDHEQGSEGRSLKETLGTFFDYLPMDSIMIFDNILSIRQAEERIENEIDRFLMKARSEEKFHLEKTSSYLTGAQWQGCCEPFQKVHLDELTLGTGRDDEIVHMGMAVNPLTKIRAPREEEGMLHPVVEQISAWLRDGNLVTFLCAGQEEIHRMDHLLSQYDLSAGMGKCPFLSDLDQGIHRGRLVLREGRITSGFHLPDLKLVIITDEEIFGKKVSRRSAKSTREGYFLKSFGELTEGNYVVHTDHGIGLYRGLQKLHIGGIENDFLLLEYLDGDKLYLPVDRLDQIQRYIGPEDFVPRVDKLGGTSWDVVKERVKKSVREVAEELVSIYAAREVMEGHSYSQPDRVYDEFCSTFEFEETPDQARSIEDVHLDMNCAKPMDRLVCGDAGFGKTEVALRASFRAAMDGKQVAVLVPTTILAEQHFQNFSRRLKNYPVCVEVLNRLKTKADQKKIIERIRKGTVDILIGTHRILQDDITFKDLGLVVIDEEQRFGVAHKEKLKKLRTLVDVLTLTATPIPRTLHLSLVGIRDLSIIHTPPENRLPVKTYILEFDEDVIREAIRQEIKRGGQAFFLHDRVQSIYRMASFIEKLVPEAVVDVVHGRMNAKEIEQAMANFIRRDCNVLVCTSIVASGLDIPSANTIIINRADRFGLAQLYQLRGRVGRSKEEAYAYLLVPKGAMLSRDAQRRLRVIMDFSEPGSGFRIASNDLEIRGTGNILGTSQSGHISAVGYELYTELMERTIREIKGEPVSGEEIKPEIHLNLPAFIPEDYMADVNRRLVTYKRLSMAPDDDALIEIREELMDCFGYIPPEVETLFDVIRIRNLVKVVKGTKMGYDGKHMFISFHSDSPVDPLKIVRMSQGGMKDVRLTPDLKLYVSMPGLHGNQIIEKAKGLLHLLIH